MQTQKSDKFTAMLGFAKRARKIVYGIDNIKGAKKLYLLAVSDTAADNLKDGMKKIAAKRGIALVTAVSLETLVGNNCKALGISNADMARAMLAYAESGDPRYSL